jgi:tetratricopeptide (TPR) repeat protein
MVHSILLVALTIFADMHAQVAPQAASPAQTQHEAGFEAERQRANELFLAQKLLEALPLYEDLCRQDRAVAVFAERHGAGLLAKEATLSDPAERMKLHQEAMQEIKRAQSLGDNSDYVRVVLSSENKNLIGAVLTGVPLTVGYTYSGNAEAQAAFREAEAAFGRSDLATALKGYINAAALDPTWYAPALEAGDTCFRLKETGDAGAWFARAISIDPDRETAYRYWGDALLQAGDPVASRQKFVEAVVAEPSATASFLALGQWARRTGHQLVKPAITRPDFSTPDGKLKADPELAASTQDGRSSWLVYQQYRVDRGARTLNQTIVAGGSDVNGVVRPSGYRHTVEEEHAALRAMLSEIDAKLKDGTLVEGNLDVSIRNLRNLERSNVLGAWIAINAADAGIRSDYPEYRAYHRKHLLDYVNAYLIRWGTG